MSTWQGALVHVADPSGFAEIARQQRLVAQGPLAGWVLVDVAPQLGRLGPPAFAKELSTALNGSVIAFFQQTSVMNERIEHWESGELVRELEYYLDGGGWIAQAGAPQRWEPSYFFSDDEGTADGSAWPANLADDLAATDIERYERAKAENAPAAVLDLLAGGSIPRLCRFYGVDPARPSARYVATPNWRPRAAAVAVVGLLVAAVILGAMTR